MTTHIAARPTAPPRPKRWEIAVFAVTLVVGGRFALKRLGEGFRNDFFPDFDPFFLPAARAILAGDSPYTVYGYVHPPMTAAIVAVLESLPGRAVEPWLALQTVAASGSCILLVWTFTPGMRLWLRSALLAFAFVTLLSTRTTLRVYYMGQSDFLVLLGLAMCVFAFRRGRPYWAGVALGLPAMVKLWPALFCVWVFSRGLSSRRAIVMGVTSTGLATIAMTMVWGGVGGVADLLGAAARLSNQGTTSFSALGAAEGLFSDASADAEALHVSTTLLWLSAAALTLIFLGGLFVALRKLEDHVLGLLCVVAFVLLLIPVSHFVYQISALPILWYWAARLPRLRADPLVLVPFLTSSIWWFVYFYWTPVQAHWAGPGTVVTTGSYLAQFGMTAANAVVTLVFGLLVQRRAKFRAGL